MNHPRESRGRRALPQLLGWALQRSRLCNRFASHDHVPALQNRSSAPKSQAVPLRNVPGRTATGWTEGTAARNIERVLRCGNFLT